MKTFLKTAVLSILILSAALCLAFGASAAETDNRPVLFIKDGGNGDGSSADSPLSITEQFVNKNSASPPYHWASLLFQAAQHLSYTGGTIVVCGEVKLDASNTAGSSDTVRDFYMPEHPDAAITITSVWNGVDYREQGARLVLQHPAHFYSGGDLTFRDINICTMPSDKGTAAERIIAAYGYDLTMDEGTECIPLDKNGKAIDKPADNLYPSVVGGHRFSSIYRANIDPYSTVTLKSGTFNRVNASTWGIGLTGNYNVMNTNVHVIVDGDTVITGDLNGTSHRANPLQRGDVTITINSGTVEGSIMAAGECGYGAPNCTFRLEINGGEIKSPILSGKPSTLAENGEQRYNPIASILDLSGCPAELAEKLARKGRNFTDVIPSVSVVTEGKIVKEASKTAYFEGDAFDADGLKISLSSADNGYTVAYDPSVSAFRFEPSVLSSETTAVKVFFGDLEVGEIPVTVSYRPQIEMKGAMIRLSGEKQTLRFVALLGDAPKDMEVVRYGMILNAADYFSEISLEQPGATVLDLTGSSLKSDEHGLYFVGSITDIAIEEYNLAYTAAAYVTFKADGTEYTCYSAPITRSVKSVADAAVGQGSHESLYGIKALSGGVISAVETGRTSTPIQSNIDRMVNQLHQNMVDMASVKWKANANLDFANDSEFTSQLQYTKGAVYTGIPYVAGEAAEIGLDQWLEKYPEGSTYTGPTGWNTMWGNQCTTSIINALQTVNAGHHYANGFSIQNSLPRVGHSTYIPVGGYTIPGTSLNTQNLSNSFGKNDRERANVVYEAYAQCKSGDFIVSNWISAKGTTLGHIRIVDEVHVVRNTNGTVNAGKSYMLTTEQCSTMDKTAKTTWRINYKYSFTQLFNYTTTSSKYLPIRLINFETGYQETPLLSVSDRNTPDNIKNGLMGKVYSNYQLTHVRVIITDNAGKQVGMYETYPYTVQYVSLNSLDLNNEVAKLKKGDYHYELQVSYAGKTESVVSFDFSK